MSGDGCSRSCGWCGRCSVDDEPHLIARTCTGCGLRVWVRRDEDYTVQVFCEHCQYGDAAVPNESYLAALTDPRR